MANERLLDALLQAGLTSEQVAERIGVDRKSVERWITQEGRTPYARHRRAVSVLLGLAENYLWPAAVSAERQTRIAASEIVGVYPHRNAIPVDLWNRLLAAAVDRIDILVHAGLFLVERPDFVRTLAAKAADGVTVRIVFGDPDSDAVRLRGDEEQLGEEVLASRIRYGLVPYSPLLGTPGIEFRFHATTLYNSIFRFDEELIVNNHVYGVPGAHAPALHLRKLGAGDLYGTYVKSFTDVWRLSRPASW
ncbi:XRE family transcriptional regulator [Pseudonocardia spinosispora]|uniref:XRE family transcriptional regulator n=1 Tax=Pseudonocardia spinosispora TaxID=103441 RepID=UPI00048A53A5|nr:XRE family transcriptional regulator [Pseudonocardia spinosispora]